MRSFYLAIELLKNLFREDINVHTITHGLSSLMDIDKKNIFPLVHLRAVSSRIQGSYISITFEIVVVDLRNISKQSVKDKFLGNDNELDNLNTCLAILNRGIVKLQNLNNDHNIELNGEPQANPIIGEFANLLDGWGTELELLIPNTEIKVC
ncbi:hypothetical protein [Flavobacterium kingsejongi]|uniref:Uncharacterized protein n=1 Tax=Flavobacterium kingsejongi TaxID=1678728 RepID=A0A2S1LQG5_9FLAO|nr:hypothetical protein [Flavobacterium kingsejongi]AWG26003.1 hypothetical protein FK004_12605 [Flavobacterium kingsejongi]